MSVSRKVQDYAASTWGVAPTVCTWLALKVAAVLIYIEGSVRDFG